MLWYVDETWLFFLAVAVFSVAIEIGFRLGRRRQAGSDDITRSHFSALQTALLGLLSLLLGFNFAMSGSRFDARKDLMQKEAAAIGSAYSRAMMMPSAFRDQATSLLRGYLAERIRSLELGFEADGQSPDDAAAVRYENELWLKTQALADAGPASEQTQLFIESLDAMTTVHRTHRAAYDNHVPELVINLLFIVALGSMAFIGFGSGLSGRRHAGSTTIFAILIALVLTSILDMDRPRRGLVRVNADNMVRLQHDLEQMTPGTKTGALP